MKFKVCGVILIVEFLLLSCTYHTSQERNKIVFEDKLSNVQDSLYKTASLIKKFPDNGDSNINYEIKNNSLLVNDGPGREDSIKHYTNYALSFLTDKEKKEFSSLSKYLSKNSIVAGYIDYHSNLILFCYRQTPGNEFNDVREIAFKTDFNLCRFKDEYKVLDEKLSIVLIAPKEARIN